MLHIQRSCREIKNVYGIVLIIPWHDPSWSMLWSCVPCLRPRCPCILRSQAWNFIFFEIPLVKGLVPTAKAPTQRWSTPAVEVSLGTMCPCIFCSHYGNSSCEVTLYSQGLLLTWNSQGLLLAPNDFPCGEKTGFYLFIYYKPKLDINRKTRNTELL